MIQGFFVYSCFIHGKTQIYLDFRRLIRIFALGMMRLKHIFVWLSRFNHCWGFGIQSPTDYWFVRYVINEHWPYYQYAELGKNEKWLTRKLGRLYFRIANWRQPKVFICDGNPTFLQSGCETAVQNNMADHADLILIKLEGDYQNRMFPIYNKVDENSILILEGIWKDLPFWQEVVADSRTGVTFDLYYCGIVMFDKKRHKENYIINF